MERIREATVADLSAICEMEKLCFEWDGFSARQFAYLITRAKGVFLVLQWQDKIVAYLSLLHRAKTHHVRIYSVAVHPDFRNKKFGQMLINRAAGYARTNNARKMTLEVNVANVAAIGLYEKNGFVKARIIPSYYHDGADAYYMQCNL